MSQGDDIRSQIRELIDSGDIRTTITIRAVTTTPGDSSGYSADTEVVVDSEVNSIPSQYAPRVIGLEPAGDLVKGEMKILVRDDVTVTTDDRVTYLGDEFHIRRIDKIPFNELIMAQELTLSKQQ